MRSVWRGHASFDRVEDNAALPYTTGYGSAQLSAAVSFSTADSQAVVAF